MIKASYNRYKYVSKTLRSKNTCYWGTRSMAGGVPPVPHPHGSAIKIESRSPFYAPLVWKRIIDIMEMLFWKLISSRSVANLSSTCCEHRILRRVHQLIIVYPRLLLSIQKLKDKHDLNFFEKSTQGLFQYNIVYPNMNHIHHHVPSTPIVYTEMKG